MKIFCTTLLLLLGTISHSQRVPISAYTYENCTDIDHYFGETDTLLLQQNIHTVKVFFKTETEQLHLRETYEKGKKIKVEEFDIKTGKPERTIQYTYGPNILDAYITHYPSPDNFNLWPSRTFYYLERNKGGETFRPYKRDTTTNIVKMHIRHTFHADGTVSFEGFNMDEKLIDTFTLSPIITWEEYQNRPKPIFPKTIKTGSEEYVYNAKGKLVSYKRADRENKYFYDKIGLLTREERFEYGKLKFSKFYKYE